MMITYKSEG